MQGNSRRQPVDVVAQLVDALLQFGDSSRRTHGQTNFILRASGAGKPINIKKGQFLAPWDMKRVVDAEVVDDK